jgi:copper resistance protein D
MHTLYIISVFIHILSAIVWVGGMFFLILVLIPVLREPEHKGIFSRLFSQIGTRFRTVGWVSLFLLIVTGTLNLAFRGYGISDLISGRIFEGRFGRILLEKLVIVALILLISVVHDFWIGPRASDLIRQDPQSPASRKFRGAAVMLGRINFILAVLVVLLAVMLVRGGV